LKNQLSDKNILAQILCEIFSDILADCAKINNIAAGISE